MKQTAIQPSGEERRCRVCGHLFDFVPSFFGDATCPNCGSLLWKNDSKRKGHPIEDAASEDSFMGFAQCFLCRGELEHGLCTTCGVDSAVVAKLLEDANDFFRLRDQELWELMDESFRERLLRETRENVPVQKTILEGVALVVLSAVAWIAFERLAKWTMSTATASVIVFGAVTLLALVVGYNSSLNSCPVTIAESLASSRLRKRWFHAWIIVAIACVALGISAGQILSQLLW